MSKTVKARVKDWDAIDPRFKCCPRPPEKNQSTITPGEEFSVDLSTARKTRAKFLCELCGKVHDSYEWTDVLAWDAYGFFYTTLELLDLDEGPEAA